MTRFFNRAVRRTAAGAALALAATGTALVAAPATAASASLAYNCTSPQIPGGPYVFAAVIDTNAPATLGSGLTAALTTTATVIVPANLADQFRAGGVTTVDGSAAATGTVDGVHRQTTLTIPKTAVTPTVGTTTTVVGTGPSGSITGGAAGTSILLGAGDFTAAITGYNSAGIAVGPAYNFTCTLQAGQNLLVDTVSIVKAPTTVALTVLEPPVEYGEQATVTAIVASTASNKKPDGTVEFTIGGTTIKAEVKGGKATAIFPPAVDLGMQQVTAAFTPTDPNLAPSTATKNFRVLRDQTTTEATAVYRAAARPARGQGQGLRRARHRGDRVGQVRPQAQRGQDPNRHQVAQRLRQGQEGLPQRRQARSLHRGCPLPRVGHAQAVGRPRQAQDLRQAHLGSMPEETLGAWSRRYPARSIAARCPEYLTIAQAAKILHSKPFPCSS